MTYNTITKRVKFLFLVLLSALAVCSSPTKADGLIVIHTPVNVPEGHYRFAPLEVKHHHVNVTITDQVAVTAIDQVFHNPNHQRLEGTYIFPIPRGAQIDRFTMDINGTEVEAELLDAKKARKIYEDIVRSMRDPALLEYIGQGLFKARIFPIEPKSDKHITLKYTQVLKSDSGLIDYTYPLNTEKFSAQPIDSVSIKIDLTTNDPIKSIYCPSHKVEIKQPAPNRAVIGFETSNARPDIDFQLLFATKPANDDPIGLSMMTYRESEGTDGFFMLLATPRKFVDDDQVIDKDIVFVLDTSGSMAGEKLKQAKRALRFCLENLNEHDRFEIVRFSTEAEPLFDTLAAVTDENLTRAIEFIDTLKPMGGTAIEEALLKSIASGAERSDSDRPFMIIFLTDGRPTIGNTDEDKIVSAATEAIGDNRARIFCFGIGTDINTHLLDRIAEKSRATTTYVLPEEDIEVKVSNFYTKVDSPVLANPSLKVTGSLKINKVHPGVGALPDVFKGDQLVIFGRYSGSGDAAIRFKGSVNGKKQTIVHEATFTAADTRHDFIPRLWATRRIGYLLDEIRLHGESKELRDEVVDLARTYSVVTPYTSYLIVEDEANRGVPITLRSLEGVAGRSEGGQFAGRRRAPAAQAYRQLRESDSGAAAVHVAKSVGIMKDALVFGHINDLASSRGKEKQSITRFVNGRAFYRNGETWIDSTIQDDNDLKHITVKFNSDEYFDLLVDHPDLTPWLALGQSVHVRLGDTVYEIEEQLNESP